MKLESTVWCSSNTLGKRLTQIVNRVLSRSTKKHEGGHKQVMCPNYKEKQPMFWEFWEWDLAVFRGIGRKAPNLYFFAILLCWCHGIQCSCLQFSAAEAHQNCESIAQCRLCSSVCMPSKSYPDQEEEVRNLGERCVGDRPMQCEQQSWKSEYSAVA